MRLQLLSFSLLAVAAAVDFGAEGGCSAVTFTVSATAENSVFQNSPSPDNATQIDSAVNASFAGGGLYLPIANSTVNGKFDIAATYCEPSDANKRDNRDRTLQLLVHGATYNSTYWSGLGFSKYSWVDTALERGHATLAIDRVGHGYSSHPDPISTVQFALHVETIHQLISNLRSGPSAAGLSTFDRILYVGHSYGSYLANGLSAQFPNDADAMIITGYSTSTGLPTPVGLNDFKTVEEAPGLDTVNRDLPPGYLRATNETGRAAAFYGKEGLYDPAVLHFDIIHADTSTVGELLGRAGFSPSKFKGPILLVTGRDDAIFCSESQGPCEGQLRRTQALFPNASRFDTYVANSSGHCLNLDYAAPTTFNKIQDWVDGLELGSKGCQ